MSTASERMLKALLKGETIGTDNQTCARLGTNQVPDVARKLRSRGVKLQDTTKRVIRFGTPVNVKEYFLPTEEISRLSNGATQ